MLIDDVETPNPYPVDGYNNADYVPYAERFHVENEMALEVHLQESDGKDDPETQNEERVEAVGDMLSVSGPVSGCCRSKNGKFWSVHPPPTGS